MIIQQSQLLQSYFANSSSALFVNCFVWTSHSTVFIQLNYYHWLHRNHILAVGCRCRTLLVAVPLHAWLPCIGLSRSLSQSRTLFAQEVKYMLKQIIGLVFGVWVWVWSLWSIQTRVFNKRSFCCCAQHVLDATLQCIDFYIYWGEKIKRKKTTRTRVVVKILVPGLLWATNTSEKKNRRRMKISIVDFYQFSDSF